jgi:hypothetical protein
LEENQNSALMKGSTVGGIVDPELPKGEKRSVFCPEATRGPILLLGREAEAFPEAAKS